MKQVAKEGICKTCRRPYSDRVWGEDEYIRQNRARVELYGENCERAAWRHIRATYFPQMTDCPLNCKWIVEFSDKPV